MILGAIATDHLRLSRGLLSLTFIVVSSPVSFSGQIDTQTFMSKHTSKRKQKNAAKVWWKARWHKHIRCGYCGTFIKPYNPYLFKKNHYPRVACQPCAVAEKIWDGAREARSYNEPPKKSPGRQPNRGNANATTRATNRLESDSSVAGLA